MAVVLGGGGGFLVGEVGGGILHVAGDGVGFFEVDVVPVCGHGGVLGN